MAQKAHHRATWRPLRLATLVGLRWLAVAGQTVGVLFVAWGLGYPVPLWQCLALIALSLGYIVAGAILIEIVFSWPGVGRAVYLAVQERDYPMLQGAVLLLTISVVICNLIADLLYFKLDPRITE